MTATATRVQAPIEELEVGAYTVPTDAPEADGTLAWDSTTIVVVHAYAGGECGLGYTYADVATAKLIESKLASIVARASTRSIRRARGRRWSARFATSAVPGISSMAIAAVDTALWDLKARLLGLPLCKLLGMARDRVPVYGSGGFTALLARAASASQLGGWAQDGIPRVKMKVGSSPDDDPERVARRARGDRPEARAVRRRQRRATRASRRCALAERFRERRGRELVRGAGVLRRPRGPAAAARPRAAGMAIAAGEYGYDLPVLRADARRRAPSTCSRPT